MLKTLDCCPPGTHMRALGVLPTVAALSRPFSSLAKSSSMIVKVVGHRGFGASDAPFHAARDQRLNLNRVPEGTIQSLRRALEFNADGVEMDAIETGDGSVVGTHADEVRQHILVPYEAPEKFIGRMSYAQIKDIPVGPGGAGRISLLKDILLMMKDFPDRSINIELKGKLFNFEDDSRTSPSLVNKTASIVEAASYPLENVVYSSFACSYLEEVCEAYKTAPVKPQVGMLFEPLNECIAFPHKIMKDRDDVHQPLTLETMQSIMARLPLLSNIHAEIRDFTPEIVRFMKVNNLRLVTWGLRELSPMDAVEEAKPFADAIDRVLQLARDAELLEVVIITDFIEDVKAYLLKKHSISTR